MLRNATATIQGRAGLQNSGMTQTSWECRLEEGQEARPKVHEYEVKYKYNHEEQTVVSSQVKPPNAQDKVYSVLSRLDAYKDPAEPQRQDSTTPPQGSCACTRVPVSKE
ncbi:hypothetical protein, conserved [Eimeria tenella]|uniref:Uncharacterized protein n=1 Tax=Eimeria tenella TaxID=5802 RepID=U6KYI8_EIMTE|nr:hypothetical protein, conserved [Eimeria tenella]CDJ40560.1 hypothetical protein, conserved [Eimeria tenella]|eukprot:XP_013231310.1 hypothetical protein, conserved [Eimeria tenella]